MFPSMNSLVSSAKERKNYDFISNNHHKTITIKSKDNSLNHDT